MTMPVTLQGVRDTPCVRVRLSCERLAIVAYRPGLKEDMIVW